MARPADAGADQIGSLAISQRAPAQQPAMRIVMSNAYASHLPAPRTAEATALLNEDWLAVILGLFIFVSALAALVHVDLIGWVVSTSVWSNFGQALGPVSKGYAALGGIGAL